MDIILLHLPILRLGVQFSVWFLITVKDTFIHIRLYVTMSESGITAKLMEKIMYTTGVMPLAYADDVDIPLKCKLNLIVSVLSLITTRFNIKFRN